jgi:hypothetical protein
LPFLAVGLVVGGLYQSIVIPRFQQYPVEPLKEASLHMRGAERMGDLLYPPPETVLTGGVMMITPVYDPAHYPIQTVETLRTLMARAREEEKPLLIAAGHVGYARAVLPEVMALLEDPEVFKREKIFRGTRPMVDRYVYRLREETGE